MGYGVSAVLKKIYSDDESEADFACFGSMLIIREINLHWLKT